MNCYQLNESIIKYVMFMFNESTSVLLELWGLICSLTVCTECNKPFSIAVILRAHLRTHPGEKPRICARCKKSFSEATDLRRHIGEGSQVCTSALNATNHSVHLLFWVLAWGLTLEGSHTKYFRVTRLFQALSVGLEIWGLICSLTVERRLTSVLSHSKMVMRGNLHFGTEWFLKETFL